MVQEVPEPMMQPVMRIVERPLDPLEAIIDKELDRSCVEKSERVLADESRRPQTGRYVSRWSSD